MIKIKNTSILNCQVIFCHMQLNCIYVMLPPWPSSTKISVLSERQKLKYPCWRDILIKTLYITKTFPRTREYFTSVLNYYNYEICINLQFYFRLVNRHNGPYTERRFYLDGRIRFSRSSTMVKLIFLLIRILKKT